MAGVHMETSLNQTITEERGGGGTSPPKSCLIPHLGGFDSRTKQIYS